MSNKIKVIGEIGSNHMNDFETGKQLIDLCKETGCELAKFQLFRADDFIDAEEYKEKKKNELGFDLAKAFFDYGKEKGIDVFFSVFYPEAVTFCESIGVKYYKIAASFAGDKKIVDLCLDTGKPVFISFSKEYEYIPGLMDNKRVIPFYTVAEYPPRFKDFDVDFLKRILKLKGGYSNHYTDLFFPCLSVYLGSEWIELHIKLERGCEESPDNVCSLTPRQLKEFVEWKNRVEGER